MNTTKTTKSVQETITGFIVLFVFIVGMTKIVTDFMINTWDTNFYEITGIIYGIVLGALVLFGLYQEFNEN